MNYWDIPIIIGRRKIFWEIARALVSYLISQYNSWIGDWGTAEDALRGDSFLGGLDASNPT